MSIIDKIKLIYPSLSDADFIPSPTATIYLENALNGKGDYIKSWSHPDFPQPTEQQLAEIK
jgi:hypothetical protein